MRTKFTGYSPAFGRPGPIVCAMCVVDYGDVHEIQSCDPYDSPVHCAFCNRPISHALTPAGVRFVLAAIRVELVRGRLWRLTKAVMPGNHYDRRRSYDLMCDWLDLLNPGQLDGLGAFDKRMLRLFHAWSTADSVDSSHAPG